MEELLNILNVFVSLNLISVRHISDPETPNNYIFTLSPPKSTEFDQPFSELVEHVFPQEIFLEITNSSIEFRATHADQDKLVDTFCEILKQHINDETAFYMALEAYNENDEQPFPRLLEKYKLKIATPELAASNTTDTASIFLALDVEKTSNSALNSSSSSVQVEDKVEVSEDLSFDLASLHLPCNKKIEPKDCYITLPTEQDRIHWGLQADLSQIVKLMDEYTQPTKVKHFLDLWGGIKNIAQKTKNNVINPYMGYADAAINVKEKFRELANIVGRLYELYEIKEIIPLVTSRLTHVTSTPQLKLKHAEEIAYLTSAEVRAQNIQEYLEKRMAIQQQDDDEKPNVTQLMEDDALLTPASQGYRS